MKDIIKEIQNQYRYDEQKHMVWEGYNNAIKTLSADLYAKNFHFLYEIIQNADDNSYHSGIEPKLVLSLKEVILEGKKEFCLIISNNETGFNSDNVKAICSVGSSTKITNFDSIGEKGIGFKSVFRITDCPYIFSNEFAFKLPAKNPDHEHGLGFITPFPVIETNLQREMTTEIYLPLSRDINIVTVKDQLLNINQSTILFLRKLKILEINIDLPGYKQKKSITRIDEGHTRWLIIDFKKNSKKLKYYIFEEEIDKPENIRHSKREAVTSRKISVAFPIMDDKTDGVLFSYLPVWENTGLPFMVNADFLLTSDRENLHEDYDWNIWLRNEISNTYIKGFLNFINNNGFSLTEKLTVYHTLPQQAHHQFLNTVVEQILLNLKNEKCILSYHTRNYFSPTDISITYTDIYSLFNYSKKISPNIIDNSIPLVSDQIINDGRIDIFKELGIKQISLSKLVNSYFKSTDWMIENSDEWFIDLYEILRSKKSKDLDLTEIKIVPLEGKVGLFSSSVTNIYFNLKDKSTIDSFATEAKRHLRIDTVKQSFLKKYLHDDSKEKKGWLQDNLNIYDFNKENLAIDLLNIICDENNDLSNNERILITESIYKLYPSTISDNKILLVLSDESIRSKNDEMEMVVPDSYMPENGWQHIFAENERDHFCILSDKYSKEIIKALINGKANVKLYPSFEKNNFTYFTEPKTQEGKELKKKLIYGSANAYVSDIKGYEILLPSSLKKISESTSIALFNYLITINLKLQSWRNEYDVNQMLESGLWMQGEYQNRGNNIAKYESALLQFIKYEKWLYSLNLGFQVPSSVFIDIPEIREVLDNNVPYVTNLSNKILINLLGLKDNITRESLINYLVDIQKDIPPFKTILKIYNQLDQRITKDKPLGMEYQKYDLIYIKESNSWLNAQNCIWEDPKEISDNITFTVLSKCYDDSFKKFFIDKLRVQESLSIDFYLSKWTSMQEGITEVNEGTISSILRKIKSHVIKNDNEQVQEFLKAFKVYSSNKKSFYKVEDIYFAGNNRLHKLFKNEFIKLSFIPGNDGYAAWVDFYNSLGVKQLTDYIGINLSNSVHAIPNGTKKFLSADTIKLIGAYLKTKYENEYDALLKENVFEKLFRTNELVVKDSIKVEYSVVNEYASAIANVSVFFDLATYKFYYTNDVDKIDIADSIAHELRKVVDLPSFFKDKIENYIGEPYGKRKEKENLDTPHEVNEIYKTLTKEPTKPSLPVEPEPNDKANSGNTSIDGKENDALTDHQNIINQQPNQPKIIKVLKPEYQEPKTKERPDLVVKEKKEVSTREVIDKEKERTKKEIEKLQSINSSLDRKDALLKKLKSFKQFQFGWLKTLTELEYLRDIENSTSNAYTFVFNKVEIQDNIVSLDLPNKYIPNTIEQYENLKLIFYTESETLTISVQSLSVNKYNVRAKLWNDKDVNLIKRHSLFEKVVLKIESVDFLWKTLLDQLLELEFNDSSNLRELIKSHKMSFIFGPPGTGKTTTIVNNHIIPALQKKQTKTLVLAPTNKAADVITNRLIDSNVESNFFRFGNTGDTSIEKHASFIGKNIEKLVDDFTIITTIARYAYDIITISGSQIAIKDVKWDKIIIDEASMINLAQIVGVILKSSKSIDIIIAGDPFQIRPILNLPEWEGLNIYDLVELNSFKSNKTAINGYIIHKLMTQYRSLRNIGVLYSEYCYSSLLNHNRGALGKPKYSLFESKALKTVNTILFPVNKDVPLYCPKYLGSSSYHLYLSIILIEWLLEFVQQFSEDSKRIGIISPYRAQSDLIFKLVNANLDKFKNNEILVSTVHGFQGDECDIIICAFNPPKTVGTKVAINDKNILNVAISRAKDHLIMFVPDNFNQFTELNKLISLTNREDDIKAKLMEKSLFGSMNYIEDIIYTTAHHPINVFGKSKYKYEIRIEDDTLDIQINES